MTALTTANLGFPRIGRDRELKWALERHWRGDLDAAGLEEVARSLRAAHWQLQADRGIDHIPSGDFSLYDHVLDTACTLGVLPPRFAGVSNELARSFTMARGADGAAALGLTKWFDTNYHHLVPELVADQSFSYAAARSRSHFEEAQALGITTRPVLLGPLTFLRLAKRTDGGPTVTLLDALLPVYELWLADLERAGATTVQIDEPALVLDLDPAEVAGFRTAFDRLRAAAPTVELTVATYFGELGPNLDLAVSLPIDVLHVDVVREPAQLADVVAAASPALGVSLGVVDGRNVWRTDLAALAARLRPAIDELGPDRVHLAPSCSLLHLPVDVTREEGADTELSSWLAFAVQRLGEVTLLAAALGGDEEAVDRLQESAAAVAARARSPRVRRPSVQERLRRVTPDQARRALPAARGRSARAVRPADAAHDDDRLVPPDRRRPPAPCSASQGRDLDRRVRGRAGAGDRRLRARAGGTRA